MGLDEELKRQGYEFDDERTEREAPVEIWINKKVGLGVRLEWLRLWR